MHETHYVVVVHGTWSAPTADTTQWWQASEANDNFCSKLNHALSDGPIGRAVWRNLTGEVVEFRWSGANTHEERIKAGSALATYLKNIFDHDHTARVHLVSHSHGGNVVLKAMDDYLWLVHRESWEVAKLTMFALITGKQPTASDAIAWAVESKRGAAFLKEFKSALSAHPEIVSGLEEEHKKHPDGFERDVMTGRNSGRRDKVTDERSAFSSARDPGDWEFDSKIPWFRFYSPFMQLWQRTVVSQQIGRMVFLGTPFFEKKWTSNQNRSARIKHFWVRFIYAFILTGPAAGVLLSPILAVVAFLQMGRDGLWLAGFCVGSLGIAIGIGWVSKGTGFFGWMAKILMVLPIIVVVALAEIILFSAAARIIAGGTVGGWVTVLAVYLFFVMAALSGRDRRDVNPYFSEKFSLLSTPDGARPVFDALVVHAGKVDEVFLGFSLEPVISAILFPRVEALLSPRPLINVGSKRLGEGSELDVWGQRHLRGLVNLLKGLAYRPVWFLFGRLIVRRAQNAMLNALLSPAYGFGADEYRDGRIHFSHEMGIKSFFSESSWDVSELLAVPMNRSVDDPGDVSRAWSFLWNDQERARRIEQSDMWKRLGIEVPLSGNAQIDAIQLKSLQENVLSMEQRLCEFREQVEFRHSLYANNDTVIGGIASFLNTGRVGGEEGAASG